MQTLGGFRAWRARTEISPQAWGREKALHLFQFLVTSRRETLPKDVIVDRLWPQATPAAGDRDFRVALNALYRALEPDRGPRAPSRFVRRRGPAYALNLDEITVDADEMEALIATGNRALPHDAEAASRAFRAALGLYAGEYLPERRYEDWATAERERLQMLALGAMTTLAALLVERTPLESIRLTQHVLAADPAWEEAYRVQMRAYLAQGNRALAMRTYERCAGVLRREFGVEPLPDTQALYASIRGGR